MKSKCCNYNASEQQCCNDNTINKANVAINTMPTKCIACKSWTFAIIQAKFQLLL